MNKHSIGHLQQAAVCLYHLYGTGLHPFLHAVLGCRLRREHVLFVMQPRCPAHAYDALVREFVMDETASDTRPPGTGLSLMQVSKLA